GDGAVIIAGTGSIGFAVRADRTFRCGGYGYVFGDEGSGFAIGREGVRLALRALDGRAPKDGLTQKVCEYFNVSDVRGLLAHVYEDPAPNRCLAALAPMVIGFASDGHRAAAKIVQQAALDLAELARTVAHHAELSEQTVPLVLAGGLLQENSLLTYLLETRITNELPLMHLLKNPPPPVMGALALARSMVRT
ncbi:MAG: N-acetylglucosamine kinase, partial [Vulcanimicrobiaceae bacterium]